MGLLKEVTMRSDDARTQVGTTGDALSLEVPGGGGPAIALQCPVEELVDRWHTARSLVDETGRWPLAVCCWNNPADWSTQVLDQDLFMRSEYAGEPGARADVSPTALVNRSMDADMDVDAALGRWRATLNEAQTDELADLIDYELEVTTKQFGSAPTLEAVLASKPRGIFAAERFLLDWELAQFGDAATESRHAQDIDWFMPDADQATSLLLLPTSPPSSRLWRRGQHATRYLLLCRG